MYVHKYFINFRRHLCTEKKTILMLKIVDNNNKYVHTYTCVHVNTIIFLRWLINSISYI